MQKYENILNILTDRLISNKQCCFLLLISLKCVVTEVVMFSVVAFKTLDISQGGVATHLRCGGIFSDSLITHFLLILIMK